MANRCAGLDPTWAHLPIPAPTHTAHAAASHYYCSSPAWLTSAAGAAYENEALTSALRASMAPPAAHPAASYSAAAATSSFSCPATPSSSSTSSASELLSSGGHDNAPAPASSSRPGGRALAGAGPRGGRVTKQRKPRPSRRPPTTYITADAANFRRMVQEITGLPVPSSFPAATTAAAPNWTPAPACVLPTLDTSAFLLDHRAAATAPVVPAQADDKSTGGHEKDSVAAVAAAVQDDDGSSAALLELEALMCAAAGECGFPTLESWGII